MREELLRSTSPNPQGELVMLMYLDPQERKPTKSASPDPWEGEPMKTAPLILRKGS
jgi:hypothetical protein